MSVPGDFFDVKGNFIPMKLVPLITGDELANRLVTPITERGGDTMWHYKHELGIYKPDGISYVKDEAKRALGKRSKTAHVNETVFHALIDTYARARAHSGTCSKLRLSTDECMKPARTQLMQTSAMDSHR